MTKGERMPHVVIAAAKDDAQFKAVEVRKQDNVVEVLWTRSLPADGQTWTAFAAACGIAPGRDGHDKAPRKHAASVVGLDSTGVAFYRVTAPVVEQQEMASIVRMQAESLLPLPPDQIEVAWRATPSTNGNVDITIAAARREYLHKFAGSVHDFHPGRIVLSCEGIAKAWQSLFSDRQREALLVSIGAQNTQVCLVQDGLVAQAAVLGTGIAHLVSPGDPTAETQLADAVEWFAQDLRTVLGSFGWSEAMPWPILVLSDGGQVIRRIAEALNEAGIPAKISVPEARNLRLPSGFKMQDIYDYRTPLGLSLIALEKPSGVLNLFERIAEEEEQEKATSAWRSVILAGAIAAAAMIALIATVYLTDVAGANRWTALVARPDFEAARQHQALLKTVARHRPDVLDLLTTLNAGKNDGIVLDSLHFKKGQVVTVIGQAGNTEQMWGFEKNLRAQKDLTNVVIVNPTQDNKTKKVKFTITFSYKGFSKKDAVL
jgi:Tfp pilus assembly protein PilN